MSWTTYLTTQAGSRSGASGNRIMPAAEAAARAAVIISAGAVIVFCLFALNRAFEITDEAYYVLLAMYPRAASFYISGQQWVTAPLWQATRSLALFRGMGLVILLGSSLALAHGVRTAFIQTGLSFTRRSSALIYPASAVSALLYIATINLSPCYNLLASAGAYTAAGMTLVALHVRSSWFRIALLVLAGGALGVEFVSKPSAGVATFGLLSIWMPLLARAVRQGIFCVVVSALFFTLSVIALALSNQTADEIRSSLATGLELFRMVQTEPVGARVLRYTIDIAKNASETILSFWMTIAAVGLYLKTRRAIFIAIATAVLGFTLLNGRYILGGADQYVLEMKAEFILLLCALATSLPVWSWDKRAMVLVLGLAALPYSVALGTGNSLFTQVIVSIAPWGALLAALASLDRDDCPDRIIQQMLLAAFVLAIAIQTVTSGFRAPYHLAEPLMRQVTPIDVGDIGHIKVDPRTARFVKDLDAAVTVCGIAPGAPFMGFYNIPGVALALRTVPIVTPWINNAAQATAILALTPPETLYSLVVAVLREKDGSRAKLPAALASFPAGFAFCGEATYPFEEQRIEIWRTALR